MMEIFFFPNKQKITFQGVDAFVLHRRTHPLERRGRSPSTFLYTRTSARPSSTRHSQSAAPPSGQKFPSKDIYQLLLPGSVLSVYCGGRLCLCTRRHPQSLKLPGVDTPCTPATAPILAHLILLSRTRRYRKNPEVKHNSTLCHSNAGEDRWGRGRGHRMGTLASSRKQQLALRAILVPA
jgi:hypothetical protein